MSTVNAGELKAVSLKMAVASTPLGVVAGVAQLLSQFQVFVVAQEPLPPTHVAAWIELIERKKPKITNFNVIPLRHTKKNFVRQ